MALSKSKVAALLIVGLFAPGTGLALEGHEGVEDKPSITNQPVEPPNGSTPNISLPGLPQQASDTANQVLATVQNNFQNGLDNLGESLQNLLGQNNTQR